VIATFFKRLVRIVLFLVIAASGVGWLFLPWRLA
jgi:hypothetical protein